VMVTKIYLQILIDLHVFSPHDKERVVSGVPSICILVYTCVTVNVNTPVIMNNNR
jgi:hypothetical protein